MLVVDAGNALWKSSVLSENERPQQERKAKLIAESFEIGGIDGMAVGDGELAFGLPWLKTLAAERHLPYLSANLECEGGNPFPGGKVVERGGVRIGIVGITGNSVQVEGCHVIEPVAAANAAFSALGPVDLKVVLSSEHMDQDRKLSAGVSELDFVVNGADRREMVSPEVFLEGGLLLGSGSRGKKVGVLQVGLSGSGHRWRDEGELGQLATRRDENQQRADEAKARMAQATDPKEIERFRVRLTYYEKEVAKYDKQLADRASAGAARTVTNRFSELGTDVADHPATAAAVTTAKNDIAALAPTIPTRLVPNGPFVGTAACVTCHSAEASHWSGTAHAHAYNSLVAQNRHMDQACYGCHVTGAFHPDGPHAPTTVTGLENVGCESCHGPGRDHAASPAQVHMQQKVDVALCTTCHDSKQDGGRFEADAYFAKIKHPTSSIAADGTLIPGPKPIPETPPIPPRVLPPMQMPIEPGPLDPRKVPDPSQGPVIVPPQKP